MEARGSSGASSPSAALAEGKLGFTNGVLEGENKQVLQMSPVLCAQSCSLRFSGAGDHCSRWYFLRVAEFARRGNVFY